MKTHPLYASEALVALETQRHLDAGLTTLQIWLTQPTERLHASWVLGQLELPDGARVLSLGCGVGGMERIWHEMRPDLRFVLVNISNSQLRLCLCPGVRVCMDAMAYGTVMGTEPDLIVMAYMLGHVDVPAMLRHALKLRTVGTTIVVLDIFDADPELEALLHYRAPTSADMIQAGFERVDVPCWHLHAPLDNESPATRAAVEDSMPGMWVYRG
jgi:hypothetical protein